MVHYEFELIHVHRHLINDQYDLQGRKRVSRVLWTAVITEAPGSEIISFVASYASCVYFE